MRLFSYCIPVDDGAAPNPYWGTCTLAICKPVIRRVAEVGDWVAGVGSKDVNGIDYSSKLVYAMKITQKMTLKEYDTFCMQKLPKKIPNIKSKQYARRVGDCIYDFDQQPDGKLLPSVHSFQNRATDLSGIYVLLSDHFYYFGNQAIPIPDYLRGIIKQGQGHKSDSNEPLKEEFLFWLDTLDYQPNKLNGEPQYEVKFKFDSEETYCASLRCKSASEDEALKK